MSLQTTLQNTGTVTHQEGKVTLQSEPTPESPRVGNITNKAGATYDIKSGIVLGDEVSARF